jgi:hypothetical protein
MSEPGEPLYIDRELRAMGLSDPVIEAFDARQTTNLEGLMAIRRGAIDAARILVDGATSLQTPEEVRETSEYSLGFDANATIIMGRMAA